jgi:hypothetical protein
MMAISLSSHNLSRADVSEDEPLRGTCNTTSLHRSAAYPENSCRLEMSFVSQFLDMGPGHRWQVIVRTILQIPYPVLNGKS